MNLITNLFNTRPIFTGALLDDRSDDEKKDDIQFTDIVARANDPLWSKKDTYRTYPVHNQNRSNQCGAFAMAKALGIMYSEYPQYGSYIEFSRSDIYQRRKNFGEAGMYMYDMFNIVSDWAIPQVLLKEKINNDQDSDTLVVPRWMKTLGQSFSISGGIYLSNDIDTMASIIQTTGKGIILLIFFTSDEYSRYIPTVNNRNLKYSQIMALKHYVVATDFTLLNGIKHLVVEDSSWFGGLSTRLLSEDFISNRIVMAGYPMNFKFQKESISKPSYDGITITSLQECLRWLGLFPTNISYVNSFGPVTKKGVRDFQVINSLEVTRTLNNATMNMLHKMFP